MTVIQRVSLCSLVLAASLVGRVAVAANPNAAARRCRGVVAAAATAFAQGGLASLDSCHTRRDKGRFQGDCNALSTAAAFSRAESRGTGMIGAACPPGNPVRDNYPGGSITDALSSEFQSVLEDSGSALQGSPAVPTDPAARKAFGKCHAAIGKARSTVVLEVLKRSLKCQKRLDRKASMFQALNASCRVASASSAARASAAIGRKCGGISGPDVGSCAPLPDCVVTAALASGQELAADVYGAFSCGDGVREGFEQCDDGNTDPTDGCSNTCMLPRCGDGVVQAGEQCDDGNPFDDDGCRSDCTNPVCGDGVVQTGEECDDGNTVAGDGCTNCTIDTTMCGASGADVTLVLVYNPSAVPDIQGAAMDLGYPQTTLDLPGSGAAVASRITDVVGLGVFAANDFDSPSDPDTLDDTLRVSYVSTPNQLPSGDIVRVRFDCASGTPLAPRDFACVIHDASDSSGNSITSGVSCTVSIATAP